MLYAHPTRILHHLANAGLAVVVGLFFAYIGLNAASGCGQRPGQCISIGDFTQPADPQLASRVILPAG